MKTLLLTIAFALSGILTSHVHAQTIPLTIDSAQSTATINIADATGTSQLSGAATIDLQSSNPPSGSAQLTDLNLVLDDGINVSFALVLGGSTTPGDVSISLVTPGSPGTISGDSFDQLANSFAFGGEFSVSDPFGIAGGNQTIDLSAIEITPADLNSVSVTRSGNVITVSGSFTLNESVDLVAGPAPFIVEGTFVATGEVPTPVVLLGDVNLNGTVDCIDITPFISILFSGGFQAEADLNLSGSVNFLDIFPFIGILTNVQ